MFQNLPLSAKQKESLIEDFVLRSQKTKPLVIPAQKYSTVSTQNVAPLVTQTANTPNPSLDAMQSQMQQIIPLSEIQSLSQRQVHPQLISSIYGDDSDNKSQAQGTEAEALDDASEAGTAEGETAAEAAAAEAAAAEAAAAERTLEESVDDETLKRRITGFGSPPLHPPLHREVRGLLPSTSRGHFGLVSDPAPSTVQRLMTPTQSGSGRSAANMLRSDSPHFANPTVAQPGGKQNGKNLVTGQTFDRDRLSQQINPLSYTTGSPLRTTYPRVLPNTGPSSSSLVGQPSSSVGQRGGSQLSMLQQRNDSGEIL
jgi:hypothetical protein